MSNKISLSAFVILVSLAVAGKVLALTPFPSINASLEYYPSSSGNQVSLVAVLVPQDLVGAEIYGVEIPLTSVRATLPIPTSTMVLLNGGEWGGSDWDCSVGTTSVRCLGESSLAQGQKTCIALYLLADIVPPNGLSITVLDKKGENLFSLGAELTGSASVDDVSEVVAPTTSIVPETIDTDANSITSSNTEIPYFPIGVAVSVFGAGLAFVAIKKILPVKPFVGAAVAVVGGLIITYSFLPMNYYSWTISCPQDCPYHGMQECSVSYAISTGTDSLSTEEKNDQQTTEMIESMDLLELPFKALDALDVATADSLAEVLQEVAQAVLGVPDTPAEAYGGNPLLGDVVDLKKSKAAATALNERRKLLDQVSSGIQLFAHYEINECEMTSCWVVSTQKNWVKKSSWFVPLTPENIFGNPYQHPLFSTQKANGVYLWNPSVLTAIGSGNATNVTKDLAAQTAAAMPAECRAILEDG